MKLNQISEVIDPENLKQAYTQVDEIEKLFPLLISLSAIEKQGGFKLGDINVGFLNKCKEYMSQAPQHIPSFVDVEESKRDINLASDIFNFLKKLGVLTSKLEDTATQAGFEALASALAYYNSVKMAAKNDVPGAKTIYEDLSKRFPGRPAQLAAKNTVK